MLDYSLCDFPYVGKIINCISQNHKMKTVKYEDIKGSIMSTMGMTESELQTCQKAIIDYTGGQTPMYMKRYLSEYKVQKIKNEIKLLLPNFRISATSVVYLITFLVHHKESN